MKQTSTIISLLLLCLTLQAASVKLEWDQPDMTGVDHFNLYYSTIHGAYADHVSSAGTNTFVTVSNLVVGTRYYFVATSVQLGGFESTFSNEVNWLATNSTITASFGRKLQGKATLRGRGSMR